MLDLFQLRALRGERVHELSIGLRRRLQVALEFIHEVDLLFLDEPTVGLDPIARAATLAMLKESVRKGLTVFLTMQARLTRPNDLRPYRDHR
jgi:ABC-2 type transport system ATP-binding protein